MRKTSTLIILAAALLFTANATAQVTVLTHATVIDGAGAAPQKDVTIVMENGRIRDVGPSSKVSVPAGATVVDLTGKFITPGIINAHGHVGAKTEPQLRQYAFYGVTTTTSMQTDPDEVVQVREAQKRGELRGARVSTVKYRFAPDPEVVTPAAGACQGRRDRRSRARITSRSGWTAGSARGPSSPPSSARLSSSRRASTASSPSATRTNSPTRGCS